MHQNMQLTETKFRTAICSPFLGALVIIGLSTLPYMHDIITNKEGLKSWVPVLGIESFLSDSNNRIIGFSSYRIFLYTFLIFIFSSIGWMGWYQNAKGKFYERAVQLVLASGLCQIGLILFNLRRTIWNELSPKLLLFSTLFLVFGFFSLKNNGATLRKIVVWVLLYVSATLPFFHDIITDRTGVLRELIPNFGIEKLLTDSQGYVRGLKSYRLLVYLFCIYLFSHLGWIGWFMDSRKKKIRPFLLVPATLSLYQMILIVMSWRETEFNSPSANLYITLGLSFILAINFFYNNNYSPKTIKHNTIKSSEK